MRRAGADNGTVPPVVTADSDELADRSTGAAVDSTTATDVDAVDAIERWDVLLPSVLTDQRVFKRYNLYTKRSILRLHIR